MKTSMAHDSRKSGRAVFDNQGRASWEWQTATGVFETDVTHEQLQQLGASSLALADREANDIPGRVWTRDSAPSARAVKESSTRRRGERTGQSREYQTVLQRLLRRLSG